MINKVLIANRGEIVRRVERASGDLGLRTVAVYSDADAGASYVRQAEEAVRIGEANPVKSYLNIGALVEAIRQSGADAVHPGYGFLSENASFAEAVERVGCIWVGPPALVLRAIESKCYCRDIATSVGVPVVPGSTRVLRTVDEVRSAARGLNYPILLKLDRGGGGKGIEKVERAEQVDEVFARVQRIGAMAFGSPDVYVEQAIMEPRHIEVQFIADREGNVVCLGERECSIQRRHQKLVEETPSPAFDPAMRKSFGVERREFLVFARFPKVLACRRAVHGHLALRAAADGAYVASHSGAGTPRAAGMANGALHSFSIEVGG